MGKVEDANRERKEGFCLGQEKIADNREGRKEKRKREIIFWNVAGLERQDIGFWNFIVGYDYIGLCETWLEEKGWDRLSKYLPRTHDWISFHASRISKKGRAKGGILIRFKERLE